MQAKRHVIKFIKFLSFYFLPWESLAGDDILITYNNKNSGQMFQGKRMEK